ncbi:IQ domain-containing protein E isoform X2 [Eublepharis macularius]|uniref:IQ domain-containing protein E isoform X2 n=1 Tax=Eublepharis macularius TaxID=481883 RepID=A0AA97LC78_EUBMA|nr:IQ domain-containing protein E isoform X2 [Eublepharis macularius]
MVERRLAGDVERVASEHLPTMSQGPCEERDLESVEDSLSALTYESDVETKPKKKSSRKPPKSPKSPYTSSTCLHPKKPAFLRSFKGTEGKRFDVSLVRASRQLWQESLRQDAWASQAKSDLDMGLAWSTLSDNTPEYLKEALGMKKPKHARFAPNGYIPGTPNYKEKEDMYDEIIQLKKEIQAQKCEADRMKTKLQRMEEENNRKDKQLEQLLDPSRGSEFIGTRTEPRSNSSWVINGLKQKILKLEQQCKEKDNTINKLQADIKTTNAEEMRISLETCYEEIQQLQALLVKSKSMERKSPPESRQQKVLTTAILQLSRSIKELQEENQNLKVDLHQMLRSSPASSKAKNYTEWSRQRLVRQISKLEKKIAEMENTKPPLSETSTLSSFTPPASARLDQPVVKQSDAPEDCEHVCRLAKKLQGQRAVLRNQLAAKEKEILKLKEKVNKLEAKQGVNSGQTRLDSMELHFQSQPESPTSSCLSHPASALRSRGSDSRHSPLCSPAHHRKEQAARIIQRRWKEYKTKMDEIALDKVAVVLQAAFRGHLARQKLLACNAQGQHSPGTGNENSGLLCEPLPSQMTVGTEADEEALRLIQSVFRAHTARTQERLPISNPVRETFSLAADPGEGKSVWSPFKYSPLVFTVPNPATSSPHCLQPSPLPPADEAHSDDSDDIITVSPSPGKKKTPLDFSSSLSHSLLRS